MYSQVQKQSYSGTQRLCCPAPWAASGEVRLGLDQTALIDCPAVTINAVVASTASASKRTYSTRSCPRWQNANRANIGCYYSEPTDFESARPDNTPRTR